MKNLNQIRAASALAQKSSVESALSQPGQGDRLSGFPMLLVQDGLLAALAFAEEPRKDGEGPKHAADHSIAEAIIAHLGMPGIGITTSRSAGAFIVELAGEDDDLKLRRATAESLQFLSYLKRFVV